MSEVDAFVDAFGQKASTTYLAEIGARIKAARKALGMTQDQLAALAGAKSKSGLQDNEAGKNMPGGQMIGALVRAGVNANWLLTGEGEMLLDQVASSQEHLQACQAPSMIAEPTVAGESPAQAYTAAAQQKPDNDAALSQVDPDVTMLVSRCIVAAEMVTEGKLDRQQQVALGLDTWGALRRIHGAGEVAGRIGKIADADLLLLARFVYNTKGAMSQR